MKTRAKTLTALLFCISASWITATAQTRVDLSIAYGSDFISSPSFNQAVETLSNGSPFIGMGWEVVMNHVGLGGEYLVYFHDDDSKAWWLDWNGQAIYVSYHLLGSKTFVDPFVDAGLGCAGRVFIGPGAFSSPEPQLSISIYPFVSAGASIYLSGLRVGAKLSYDLGRTAIPATSFPDYPLGRFQVAVLAGVSIGGGAW